MRSQGKTNWVHTASTEYLTQFAIHEKRGTQATIDIGILPEFTGTLIYDHWKPYYFFEDCTHAECNAHHIRTLKGIHENFLHEWAQDMGSLLVKIKRQVDSLKETGCTEMPE
jgi:transposase